MSETKKPEGKRIGKYQNAMLLAKGGMGAIYKADHPTLDKPVVLKMLTLTGNEQFTQRFQREATIMMDFQHVNIVNYYDHFKTNRSFCMVMEFVDGCSAAQLLEKYRYLDDDVALLILRDVLRALVFAHGKGVVHRDIKPANILISSRGEVKLTDFGIAQDQAVDSDGLTKEGMTLGTPSYMAPEQFRDAGRVDGRADVYSSGVLLYECLTGRKPFSGASLPEMLERIRKGRYERLRKLRPDSTWTSRHIIRRAMRARPELRFQDAAKMLRPLEAHISRSNEESLRRHLSDLVTDRRRITGETRTPGKRRIFRWVATAAASLAGVAALAGVWWVLALAGFMPSFLLPDFIGGVRLEVGIPPVNMAPPRVSLDVYQFDSVEYVEIRSARTGRVSMIDQLDRLKARFVKAKADDSDRVGDRREPVSRLVVRPVILKPGIYQLKIRVGDTISTRVVQIPSLKDRRLTLETRGRGVSLLEILVPWEPRIIPVFVDWTLRRGDTGSELTGFPVPAVVDEFGVRYKVTGNTVQLNTGRRYDFTFRVPGYTTQTVGAWLDSGIVKYTINGDLFPEPALLNISSPLPFRRPRLQGEIVYRSGEARGGLRRIRFLRDKDQMLVLPPGSYRLTGGRDDNTAVLNLDLSPGEVSSWSLERGENKILKWIEVKND